MTLIYCFVLITFGLLKYSRKYCFILNRKRKILFRFVDLDSLQSGFTCETSVILKCPDQTKIVILEVTYSSECPTIDEENNGGSMYAPSRCIGYYRERASNLCNGQQTCTIDNNLQQRPSFLVGKQANCAFTGQSINIDYSCVPGKYKTEKKK
jgi:hypothetical protein